MDRRELVKEIIGMAIPVFISKAKKYIKETPTDDEINKEIDAECEIVAGDEPRYAGPYGNLVAGLELCINDLLRDVKAQIEQEIMMKLHVELTRMSGEIFNAKMDVVAASKIGTGTVDSAFMLPHFDVTESAEITPIKTGYESIAKYSPTLAENPLFAMVEKSLAQSASGQGRSAEDFNAARKNRTDTDADAAIAAAETAYYKNLDPEVSADGPLWDKLFESKYGSGRE
jgi:hypothetical protein